jgi:hypothetical protein
VLNLVSAPISAASIYNNYFHQPFENILDKPPQYSNYTSCFASKFNDDSVYIFDQSKILLEILEFLTSATHPERERERERERESKTLCCIYLEYTPSLSIRSAEVSQIHFLFRTSDYLYELNFKTWAKNQAPS